jgi:hypothetical protein
MLIKLLSPRAKWAAKLRLALDADRLSSERVQSLHGIMQRVALVFPLGKCWVLSIRRLLAVASKDVRPGRGFPQLHPESGIA